MTEKSYSTYLLLISLTLLTTCLTSNLFAQSYQNTTSVDDLDVKMGISGKYIVVDARRASDVSAPALFDFDMPLGHSVRFEGQSVSMDGAACDDWKITTVTEKIVPVHEDPNLIDLTLAPTDSPIGSGDQQQHTGYIVQCEGKEFIKVHKVDNRVLVMPAANSAINLILERPLTSQQIMSYQRQLKSMKFYDGPINGKLDETTLRSSRTWYIDRARLSDDQPIPARPAITENLLDALGVLR